MTRAYAAANATGGYYCDSRFPFGSTKASDLSFKAQCFRRQKFHGIEEVNESPIVPIDQGVETFYTRGAGNEHPRTLNMGPLPGHKQRAKKACFYLQDKGKGVFPEKMPFFWRFHAKNLNLMFLPRAPAALRCLLRTSHIIKFQRAATLMTFLFFSPWRVPALGQLR